MCVKLYLIQYVTNQQAAPQTARLTTRVTTRMTLRTAGRDDGGALVTAQVADSALSHILNCYRQTHSLATALARDDAVVRGPDAIAAAAAAACGAGGARRVRGETLGLVPFCALMSFYVTPMMMVVAGETLGLVGLGRIGTAVRARHRATRERCPPWRRETRRANAAPPRRRANTARPGGAWKQPPPPILLGRRCPFRTPPISLPRDAACGGIGFIVVVVSSMAVCGAQAAMVGCVASSLASLRFGSCTPSRRRRSRCARRRLGSPSSSSIRTFRTAPRRFANIRRRIARPPQRGPALDRRAPDS